MTHSTTPFRVGVLTSGGDAPGMNAAVRAVVRTTIACGGESWAIYEGYKGLVEGGRFFKQFSWYDVGGILHKGGTIIGTARSAEFRTREGRRQAVLNLIQHEIYNLVVIGGDGSLTGAHVLWQEWPELVAELVEAGALEGPAERYPRLRIAGLIGSIDNDMFGSDMTIGADTALHRIVDAIDAITSTAASHQRSFVVEVMGRNCGYLALMGALASGADWVLIPESPPNVENWEDKMCDVLRRGRAIGRRDSIVVVAEGARDRNGNPITSEYVRQVIEERLQEEVRTTILGHVQRGGSPSAFDRNLGTILGYHAVNHLRTLTSDEEPVVVGLRGNRVSFTPLSEALEKTRAVYEAIKAQEYDRAMELRGPSFKEAFRIVRTLVRSLPHPPPPGQTPLRIAILNAGGPAPGMNTAARAAVRIALDKGHQVVGVRNGFQGLIDGDFREMEWMSVNGWAPMGGAELGTSRKIPEGGELYAIARNIERHRIDAILVIGGFAGYQAAYKLYSARPNYPALNIPIVCLPATIDNDLPGSELSIGADTALNNIVENVDKIKQSGVATNRVFVVEVMGRYCGYLALMSGLATGAERVYLPEEGVKLADLQRDLEDLRTGFLSGKRIGLLIRNEFANPIYTTQFMCALFEEEGGDLFDVRQAILGHIQQGGDPKPFDRVQAARLAAHCIEFLIEQAAKHIPAAAFIGLTGGHVQFHDMADFERMIDRKHERPREQWWLMLRPIADIMAQPDPKLVRQS